MKDACSVQGVFLLVACAGLVSCTGELDGTGDKPGPMPLRRLTSEEYNATVRDLVGDHSNPGTQFVGESFGDSGFATPGIVSTVDVSHGGSHSFTDLPWVMAGSCGGYFKSGRYLRHAGGNKGESLPQNGLLTALCNAMDVTVTHFGDPQYGGELGILRG